MAGSHYLEMNPIFRLNLACIHNGFLIAFHSLYLCRIQSDVVNPSRYTVSFRVCAIQWDLLTSVDVTDQVDHR